MHEQLIIREWDKTNSAEFEKVIELNLLEWGADFFGEKVREITTEHYQDPARITLVAVLEGHVVGVASVVMRDVYDIYPGENILDKKLGYFSRLVVEKAQRGKGIGRKLLEASDKAARENGLEKVFLLLTESRDSRLYKFYINENWQEEKEIEREGFGKLLILTHSVAGPKLIPRMGKK